MTENIQAFKQALSLLCTAFSVTGDIEVFVNPISLNITSKYAMVAVSDTHIINWFDFAKAQKF